MRVYNTYIKDKNYIATSFVPKNSAELALKGSTLANVVEEKLLMAQKKLLTLKLQLLIRKLHLLSIEV